MRIHIGSKNPKKVGALKKTLADYPHLAGAEVAGYEVPTGVSEQPKSLEELVTGAANRARHVFEHWPCDYAVGIESGLMAVPLCRTGYMAICACVVYDGRKIAMGLSRAFECPDEVIRLIFERGLTLSQAFREAGLTHKSNIGSEEGGIGLLTRGRVTREHQTIDAIRMALIDLEP